MYQDFYRLKKEPFHITPDPEFLFVGPFNKEALASIIYGVEKRKGFVVITSEVGLGKTTILRSYLEKADKQKLKIIYIFNSNISFKDLLKSICQEIGLDVKTDDVFGMVNHLHQMLIKEYREGFNVVLIIDEAQNMPIETLENLRMLSNLETSTDKLIQIVLIGQTEFEKMLNLNDLRQLNQRIAVRATISPLKHEESMAYIQHRLEKTLIKHTPIFTKGALKLIVKQAKGVPRILNILCDNALITGYGYQKKPVASKIVKEVIADFKGRTKSPLLRWGLVTSVILLLIASVFGLSPYKNLILSKIGNQDIPQRVPAATINEESTPLVEKEALWTKKGTGRDKNLFLSEVETQDIPQRVPATTIKEESEPLVEEETLKLRKGTGRETRIVKKGDTLFRLTLDVYGFTDEELIELVKKKNRIKNIHIIMIGEKILFPELSDLSVRRHSSQN